MSEVRSNREFSVRYEWSSMFKQCCFIFSTLEYRRMTYKHLTYTCINATRAHNEVSSQTQLQIISTDDLRRGNYIAPIYFSYTMEFIFHLRHSTVYIILDITQMTNGMSGKGKTIIFLWHYLFLIINSRQTLVGWLLLVYTYTSPLHPVNILAFRIIVNSWHFDRNDWGMPH